MRRRARLQNDRRGIGAHRWSVLLRTSTQIGNASNHREPRSGLANQRGPIGRRLRSGGRDRTAPRKPRRSRFDRRNESHRGCCLGICYRKARRICWKCISASPKPFSLIIEFRIWPLLSDACIGRRGKAVIRRSESSDFREDRSSYLSAVDRCFRLIEYHDHANHRILNGKEPREGGNVSRL